ncbi:MAG TPA: hypothetical protein VHF22_09955 [Planctomycetota bacterium]|nr:hypothetical protein [Planctomycetota bacterium]
MTGPAETPPPAAAPRPSSIALEFTQTGAGVPEGGKSGKLSTKDGSLDARLLLPCANPDCKKGGFFLRPEIDKAARAGRTEVAVDLGCSGYVGALRSERGPAGGCGNRLSGKATLVYGKAGGGK